MKTAAPHGFDSHASTHHSAWQALVGVALAIALALGSLSAAGCSKLDGGVGLVDAPTSEIAQVEAGQAASDGPEAQGTRGDAASSTGGASGATGSDPNGSAADSGATASGDIPSAATVSAEEFLARVPAYTGSVYTVLNDNVPSFTADDATTDAFERYAPLDWLGRCGSAFACLGTELVPTEERESISEVRPSGWHSSRYDFVDGESLYNRSHLIAFQLAGENANERNLITGTRHLNTDGMRPFEEMVGDYIRQTNNHVLYRVTPVFASNELVARGVQMEALSMEDGGAGISLNVYIYNVQPGVVIDYATGDNWEADENEAALLSTGEPGATAAKGANAGNMDANDAPAGSNNQSRGGTGDGDATNTGDASAEARDYVLNTSSRKFHDPSCDAVETINAANRTDVHGSRDELIAQGYAPCGSCNP